MNFKRFLLSFPIILVISLNIFCITSSASVPIEPSFSDLTEQIEARYGLDLSGYDYYINASNTDEYWPGLNARYFTVFYFAPDRDPTVYITNESYNDNHYAYPFRCVPDDNENIGFFSVTVQIREQSNGDFYYNWGLFNSGVYNPSGNITTVDSPFFYMSSMPVIIGDENINRNDYTAEITYNADGNSLLYQFWNHSDGLTFGVKCGIYGYYDFGLVTVDDNLYWGHSVDLQTVIDWAEDHDMDYLDMVAYMTIYDGINAVETVTCTISEALAGAEEEDGMFDEEKEYEDFPDPSDYFSDPPDFPDLAPTPSFPGFDPEHPIDSIAEIIRWIASVVVTWIQNVIEIVKWVNATIVYYLSNGFLFLKDCFLTLVHNIGIALYNLVVKLRALITVLVVPKKESLKERFNEVFPIFGQFKALFTSWGGGNQTITINLLGETATINAVDALGAGACSVFYNLSTLMIGATTAFALFNIITSIFGITLGGHGGDE